MAGYEASGVFAGPYLQDQLLLPVAVAGGEPSQAARSVSTPAPQLKKSAILMAVACGSNGLGSRETLVLTCSPVRLVTRQNRTVRIRPNFGHSTTNEANGAFWADSGLTALYTQHRESGRSATGNSVRLEGIS